MEVTMYLAFVKHELISHGDTSQLKAALFRQFGGEQAANLLIFNEDTGRQTDINFDFNKQANVSLDTHCSVEALEPLQKKRGRPKLGVVGREVTLLPRHWQWLDKQKGGASASLRRMIDQARKLTEKDDLVRDSQDKTNRFIFAIAGDLPGFEDATRALFASDKASFMEKIKAWPKDIKHYAIKFSENAFI